MFPLSYHSGTLYGNPRRGSLGPFLSAGCTSRPNLWLLGDTFGFWGAPNSLPPVNCLYWLLVPSNLPSNCTQLQRQEGCLTSSSAV